MIEGKHRDAFAVSDEADPESMVTQLVVANARLVLSHLDMATHRNDSHVNPRRAQPHHPHPHGFLLVP